MAQELEAYIAPTPDGTGLADYYLKSEADKVIAELKDKCQMHDFFWEGCGFAKRGFKNSIAVSEAFDKLEAEIRRLKRALFIAHAIKAKFKWWWMSECKHNESCKLIPDPRKIKNFTDSAWVCSKSQEKCRAKAEANK